MITISGGYVFGIYPLWLSVVAASLCLLFPVAVGQLQLARPKSVFPALLLILGLGLGGAALLFIPVFVIGMGATTSEGVQIVTTTFAVLHNGFLLPIALAIGATLSIEVTRSIAKYAPLWFPSGKRLSLVIATLGGVCAAWLASIALRSGLIYLQGLRMGEGVNIFVMMYLDGVMLVLAVLCFGSRAQPEET